LIEEKKKWLMRRILYESLPASWAVGVGERKWIMKGKLNKFFCPLANERTKKNLPFRFFLINTKEKWRMRGKPNKSMSPTPPFFRGLKRKSLIKGELQKKSLFCFF